MSATVTVDLGGEACSPLESNESSFSAASSSQFDSPSMTSTSQADRGDSFGTSLDWDDEQHKSLLARRLGSTGFANDRNLHLKIATPTDSDYDSDASDGSFAGTPSGTPGRMERWKSFKISSLFSRFQRQATMPNPLRASDSPRQDSFRSDDNFAARGSATFMVPYDSELSAASPKKVISMRGLLKLCGRDTSGRPIVVIDTSYCPPAYMRFVALAHIREKMEPVVEGGEYNLVFVMSPNPSRGDASKEVPTMWCLEVYRKLPYAYKKNVQRVVFIHPTFIVKLVLNLLRPFMSGKAHEKIIRIHRLSELEKASGGQITLDKLYLASHVYLHDKALSAVESEENFPFEN